LTCGNTTLCADGSSQGQRREQISCWQAVAAL
jgi:hypothetical protein